MTSRQAQRYAKMIKLRRVKLHSIEKNSTGGKEKEPKKNVSDCVSYRSLSISLSLSLVWSLRLSFSAGSVVSYILLALRSRLKLRVGKRRSYNVPTRTRAAAAAAAAVTTLIVLVARLFRSTSDSSGSGSTADLPTTRVNGESIISSSVDTRGYRCYVVIAPRRYRRIGRAGDADADHTRRIRVYLRKAGTMM
jgi:hypothetical protein